MKYRIKFSKTGNGKYISHLDLLRCFARAAARAGKALPVKFSEGFNPHPQITFLLPLPVGVTSVCELVDIEFTADLPKTAIAEAFNAELPPDLRVLDVSFPTNKAKDIIFAKYDVTFEDSRGIDAAAVTEFLSQEEALISKKSKSGVKTVNLMEFIEKFEFSVKTKNFVILSLILAAGGENNIKPSLVTDEIQRNCAAGGEFELTEIERTEIYFR